MLRHASKRLTPICSLGAVLKMNPVQREQVWAAVECHDNKLGDRSLQETGLLWCDKLEKIKLIHNPMLVSQDTASHHLRRVLSSFALRLPHSGTQCKSALCPWVRVLHHLLPETNLLSNRVQLHLLFAHLYCACRVKIAQSLQNRFFSLIIVNSTTVFSQRCLIFVF